MTTRPGSAQPDPHATDAGASFGGLGAGLGLFQEWMKAAGAAIPGMASNATAAPGTPSWSMPTLDPEELDKRIQELKTVQFWLEQNSRMIAMTIQGLEVQKMTLSTLQGMNVSMDKLRESLHAKPAAPTAPTEATTPPAADAATQADEGNKAADMVNPMMWWNALTQQFSQLASQAAQSVQATAAPTSEAQAPADAPASPTTPTAARKRSAPRKTAARKTTPRSS